MSNDDTSKAAEAAIAVVNILQPLASEERTRVLHSAAALFGISGVAAVLPSTRTPLQGSQSSDNGNQGQTGPVKKMSIVELLQDRGAVTNVQRIACFAYYREKVEGEQNFTSMDLAGYFPLAKLPAPGKNYSRDYKAAVKEGWIHDDGAKSYLTQTGDRAVEAGFSGKMKRRGATVKKRRPGKTE